MNGKKTLRKLILKKEVLSVLSRDETEDLKGGQTWLLLVSRAEPYLRCPIPHPTQSCDQHIP